MRISRQRVKRCIMVQSMAVVVSLLAEMQPIGPTHSPCAQNKQLPLPKSIRLTNFQRLVHLYKYFTLKTIHSALYTLLFCTLSASSLYIIANLQRTHFQHSSKTNSLYTLAKPKYNYRIN